MSERDFPIRIQNIFNDGCEEFAFVHVSEDGLDKIGYALMDKNGESHSQIFQEGVELDFFSGDIEPSGGGIFDASTGLYKRDSINYNGVDDRIFTFIDRKLLDLVDC